MDDTFEKTSITADLAHRIIGAAEAKAHEMGTAMVIAVCDESGVLKAFSRMDGAALLAVQVAQDKAYTAAGAKRTTESYGEVSQPGKPAYGINSAIGGRLLVVAGGIPVVVDSEVVGAIGISSGTPAQDSECACAGVERFLASL